MTAYLYEFLYRGRPPGSTQPAAWHAMVGQEFALPGQAPQTVVSQALSPEQAEAAGFPLATIIQGINADALAQVEAHREALSSAEAERDQHREALAQMSTRASADGDTISRLGSALDAARTDLASVQVDVRNLTLQIETEKGRTANTMALLSAAQAQVEALKSQIVPPT